MSAWIPSILLLLGAAASAAATTVNKCCAHGEILVPSTLACRAASEAKEKEASWTPVVFSPSKGNFLASVPAEWLIAAPKRPSSCRQPTLYRTHYNKPSFVLFTNGSLVMPVTSKFLLHPDNYCLDAARQPSPSAVMELAALVCTAEEAAMDADDDAEEGDTPPASSSVSMVVVRKCCGDGAAFNETSGACVVASSKTGSWSAPSPLKTLAGFPNCPGDQDYMILQDTGEAFHISPEDGSLNTSSTLIPAGEFCIERILGKEASTSAPRIIACSNAVPSAVPSPASDEDDLRYKLFPVALLLSAIFLAATLAAGCLLPKAHHALHWRCQTGHVASLFVGYVLLAATQIAGANAVKSKSLCLALGVIMHYFFLAAFFWLNTMCFNIWWTFRDLRPASLDKGQELCRFRGYSLYAWGAPLLIAGIGLTLDLAAVGEDFGGPVRPRFGQHSCWFYGDKERFAYFYGPVGVLLLINLILFLATARELTCGLWRREVAKSSPHADGADRATLGRVCLKLVVVMGVTWIADVISWAVGGPTYAWLFVDLINALQGVFIFVVVGCQPQVWAALRRKWCFRKVGGNGGLRRRELGNGVAHDDDDDYDESGAVGQFCRGGMGGGVTSSGRPVSTTTSEAGPFGSSPPHSLTWEGDISHSGGNHRNIISSSKSSEKIVEDKETLC